VSTPDAGRSVYLPIRSLDDLVAGTFESDDELAEFLAFTHAERRREVV
jgi:hypothetical protein